MGRPTNEERANRENMVKMNLYMPRPYKEWIEGESIKTGLSQSALVHMALKSYIDQQKSMEMVPKMMKALSELKGQDMDSKSMELILKNIMKALED